MLRIKKNNTVKISKDKNYLVFDITNKFKSLKKVVKSEEWGSEHSSGILGKFLRRDSIFQDKQRQRSKKCPETQNPASEKKITNKLPPVIAKWKPGSKLDARFEKDVLYEGLKRAQRGRLDDQRGTEINIELPDFLKDKENAPCSRKKLRKIRKDCLSEDKNLDNSLNGRETVNSMEKLEVEKQESNADYQTSNLGSGFSTNNNSCDTNSFPVKVFNCNTNINNTTSSNRLHHIEPPPLPPKPKNIPCSWRVINANSETNQKSIYLDQPTSSFV